MPIREQSRVRTFYYWCALFVTLVVVDDLTFGWIFWLVAQIHPLLSAAVAFVASWCLSYWLTLQGMKESRGKIASWLLSRLQLERKNSELEQREQRLLTKITSIGIAIPMSLLFGGVVVTLWLLRRGIVTAQRARVLAFWLSAVYAVEFAVVHGFGIGGSIFFVRQ